MDAVTYGMSVFRWIVIICFSVFVQSNASSDLNLAAAIPYDIITPAPRDHLSIVPYMITTSSSSDNEALEVTWENSTTSSIAISWQFAKIYKSNGTFLGTRVEYFLKHGKFRSHILRPTVNNFVFESLKVATTYKFCVTAFENVNDGLSSETLEHTRCFRLQTIPYIRRDSVLILLLTLSYFLFMGFMGYSQWRRRAAIIRKRVRRACENSSEPTTPVLRWREVEERQRLCFPSSIEETPRDV
ncbi:hypothetical protein KP79_PYT21370 [Mizuhopecten yessoensis]|uniref:Fibronectin type-III domain-containing protein n=1 Tax=Mizuhopecten yessoensis TaxID=6573 RepID=A0A210PML2_MIZYE|nr:hypothetical protein KP79_PYT21370 [Mizuhopecten yessoensis]